MNKKQIHTRYDFTKGRNYDNRENNAGEMLRSEKIRVRRRIRNGIQPHTQTQPHRPTQSILCTLSLVSLYFVLSKLKKPTSTHLNHRFPITRAILCLTLVTLLRFDDECDNEALLQNRAAQNLFLHSELDFQTLRMRFSPNPACVHQFDLCERHSNGCELS